MRLFSAGLSRLYSTKQSASKVEIDIMLGLVGKNAGSRGNQSMGGIAAQLARSMNPPPRTGAYAGRSVGVWQPEDLPRAVSQLGQLNRINKVREVKNLQRYHEQPGKAKWRIRMARKRREFRSGMRVLFHLALQAQKRGL